jgi:hypothetical protein
VVLIVADMRRVDTARAAVLDILDTGLDMLDSPVEVDSSQEAAELHMVADNVLALPALEGAVHMLAVGGQHSPVEEEPGRTSVLVGQQLAKVKYSVNSGLWSKESRRESFVQK